MDFRLAGPAAMAAMSLMAGCGGDRYTSGALAQDPTVVATLTPAQLTASAPATLLALAGAPRCTVRFSAIRFATHGGAGEPTTSGGAIIAPSGDDAACTGARPVVLYAHGTTTDRNYDMASARNGEAMLVAAFYAAQGYVVVAPNYAGYAGSDLSYHPYLNATQQAGEVVDAWKAARAAFPRLGVRASGKVFVSGYSQGGHVSMATQRALQLAGTPVTAGAHLSGPYALSAFGDAVFAGKVNVGATAFLPLLTGSFQKAYGNLYTTPAEIYETAYAAGIDALLPSTTALPRLIDQGRLPQQALFAPDSLPRPQAFGFGAGNLVRSSYREAVLADIRSHETRPANPLRWAAARNDLLKLDWTPRQPMLQCGGQADPTVFWTMNGAAAKTYFASRGVPDEGVVVVDVDGGADTGDRFAAVKRGFASAKAAVPATAVPARYHGELVPPFCTAAARSFFAKL